MLPYRTKDWRSIHGYLSVIWNDEQNTDSIRIKCTSVAQRLRILIVFFDTQWLRIVAFARSNSPEMIGFMGDENLLIWLSTPAETESRTESTINANRSQ